MTEAKTPAGPGIAEIIDERPIGSFQWRIVILCSLASFLDGYDLQALGLAVPQMAVHFGSDPTSFTLAVTATLIGMALGSALISPLADRIGRRPVMIVSMIVIGLTSIGILFAASPWEVGLWRFATGLGLGGTVPVATAMTAEYVPSRHRTAIVTAMICCIPIGGFVASISAPVWIGMWGWQGIFLIGGALPILLSLTFLIWLTESLRYLLLKAPDGPQTRRQLAILADGVAVRAPSPPVAGDRTQRVSVMALLSPHFRARTLLLWTLWSMNLFVNLSLISWLPSLLKSVGWSHDDALRGTSMASLGGVIGALLLSWLVDRGKLVPALMLSYIIAGATLALLTVLPADRAIWMPLLALVGVGTMGCQITFAGLAASFYPTQIRTTGVGWGTAVGRLGSIAGPLVIAAIMRAGAPASASLTALMVPILICAVGIIYLPRALGEDRHRLTSDKRLAATRG